MAENHQPTVHSGTANVSQEVSHCCCAACGNCTKAPTFDSREPCCCPTCGHCFKRPTVVQQFAYPPIVGGWPNQQYPYGGGWRFAEHVQVS